MSGLNPAQLQAVHYVDGPLLVLAGAGSGKTKVITEKVAHLIHSKKFAPEHIAAITFTNKAAREMRSRVAKRISKQAAELVTVTTFHSLGLKFLQQEYKQVGLRRGFSIFDSDDQQGLIKDLLPASADKDALFAAQSWISKVKNMALTPEQAQEHAKTIREKEIAKLYSRYQERLRTFNAVDFDDLIRLPLHILETDAEALVRWQAQIRYLLVDECQDTNGAQYRMIKALAGKQGLFTCVGDDDQSIYAWRGAQPENLEELAVDYPALQVIKLEQNYRCSARILRSANAVIANNPHAHLKTLWSEHGEGAKIRIWSCKNNEHEAQRVAAEIQYLSQAQSLPFSEFAILFRGNHQSRPLEKELQLLKIPYHITGGTAFLERGEVKDMLAWLRVIANPDDDAAFLRAITSPKREVGSTSLEKLAQMAQHAHVPLSLAAQNSSYLTALSARPAASLAEFMRIIVRLREQSKKAKAADIVRAVINDSGILTQLRLETKNEALFLRRKENLEELAQWFEADKRPSSAGDLAAQLALLSNADRGEPGNQVRLMSLHSAKGLEFACVFIVGCEQGNLPHQASIDEGQINEERRLFYVGITRAKQHLYLSHSALIKRWGEQVNLLPSKFLDELPEQDLHKDGVLQEDHLEEKKARAQAHRNNISALFDS
ncbi:MAG: UvrD-helicase domain-containing protein [Arenimonas sp.]|nr:UvrD-helicase domain-containing protein [Arenimonas sp.]MBP6309837.1 UvrD-helicase domain-containing protein [Arenimonas sp.]